MKIPVSAVLICQLGLIVLLRGVEARQSSLKWLDKEEYKTLLAENQFSLVVFSANWCPHCQPLVSVVERVQEIVPHGFSLAAGAVDCTKRAEWCSETVGVTGYPCLR